MSVHSLTLRELARTLGGEVAGSGVLCPGPGRGPRNRNLSVRPSAEHPDGFVIHSFAGDDWRFCRDHVAGLLGLAGDRHRTARVIDPGEARRRQEARERDERAAKVNSKRRRDRALSTWDEARDPRGTAVDAYLGGRCLDLSDEIAGAVLRFHPRCPFGETTVPAMVALVRDVLTDAPIGIHRTALDDRGRKVVVNGHDRLALGAVAGGAVKLTADSEVTTCLGIGEGIETALSLWRTPEFGSSPVWSLISAGNVETFPVLSGIECLWMAVDHDPAGLRAARACAARWQAAQRETFLITPDAPGADLNDLIKGAHHG
ncbi:toprim domain-containing protein [Methylobacterium sp. ARG-1]|uniref:DUF7146 domain-containing protein n=1 Tax=Methylobacterium sp. ARG-1 TaxID=1692501 RepID=UPI000681F0C9|nr:toprim domain-containing protein [Methylobacterium sp. ARG-1]KNY19134.1 hypothetical protein AKJ13_29415 [Methylobacterium sp. ARG-1]